VGASGSSDVPAAAVERPPLFNSGHRGEPGSVACEPAQLATCADAQVDKQCAEATALWIPSNSSVEKTAVKWNKSVKYSFVLPQGDDASVKRSIEDTLHLLARESGLKVELAQGADVAILIAPDISAVGPGMRKYVEDDQ
jgi:hypothetical protein